MKELTNLKIEILEKVKLAAQNADISAVTRWGKAAEQCEKFIQESVDLDNRIKTFTSSLLEEPSSNVIAEPTLTPTPAKKISPKLEGAKARRHWVDMLSSKGISLNGHNKRYHTKSGRSVGIAFANELDRPNKLDKWFLGLKDEPTDFAVLLCQDLEGKVNDFILPVTEIEATWKGLSRSEGQIKFNIRREQNEFLLLNPYGEPLDITKYLSRYQVLI